MLKSIDERIVEITRSVLDAAQADAEKIQGEAKHKEAEILKRGDLQAKQVYAEILEKPEEKQNCARKRKSLKSLSEPGWKRMNTGNSF